MRQRVSRQEASGLKSCPGRCCQSTVRTGVASVAKRPDFDFGRMAVHVGGGEAVLAGNGSGGQGGTNAVVPPVAPSQQQQTMIDNARRAAAIRTQVAMFRTNGIEGARWAREARNLARIKFNWPNPNMEQVGQIISRMGGGLITVRVMVAGTNDPECGNREGYVRGHRQPIVLCPTFFNDPPGNEGRIRTMVHEMAHVVGIGNASVAEQYYPVFDCDSTGDFSSADSWAHYVHCLSGQPADQPITITGSAGGGSTPSTP